MNSNNSLLGKLVVKVENNDHEDVEVKKEYDRDFNRQNLLDFEEIKVEQNENLEFTFDISGIKKEVGDVPNVKTEILCPIDDEVRSRRTTAGHNRRTKKIDNNDDANDPLSVTKTSFKYEEDKESSEDTFQEGFIFVNVEDIKPELKRNFEDESNTSDRNNYTVINNGMLKSYSCNLCFLKCRYKSHIDRHMMQHTGERPYRCTLCPAKFTHRGNLNGHMRIHSGEKPYQCDICSKQFSEKSNIKRHIKTHMKVAKAYRCQICSKHFRDMKYLNQHMRQLHTPKTIASKARIYKCLSCSAIFRQTSALKKHLLTHSKDKPYVCDVCFVKFELEDERDKHMVTHKLRFACRVCPSKFVYKGNLENHMKLYHSDSKL